MLMLFRIVALLLVATVATAQDATGRLDDIGTRLQFDYYTADLDALERDLAGIAALEVPTNLAALKGTYAGFGAWKHAELLRAREPDRAAKAARDCTNELERTVQLESRRAGLLAMLSACQRLVADLQGRVQAPLAAARARQSLERAVMLAAKDPHVLLIEGSSEFERVRTAGGDFSTARRKLSEATAAFEAMAASPDADVFATAMSWGPAEAWNTLGQLELAQGNGAAARDAFERALVLVGDYREVQDRLAEMTGTRERQ
jgi:tetratricopeptide (TPR) repeat protein